MSLIALNGSNLAPSFGDDKSSLASYALLLGARFTICCDYNRGIQQLCMHQGFVCYDMVVYVIRNNRFLQMFFAFSIEFQIVGRQEGKGLHKTHQGF